LSKEQTGRIMTMTNRAFRSIRVHVHWLAYALIIGIGCTMFNSSWSRRQQQLWTDMQEAAHDAAREVGLSTRSARDMVGMLQGVANALFQQDGLDLSEESRRALVPRQDKPGITVLFPRPRAVDTQVRNTNYHSLSPAFSMLGQVPPPGSDASREIGVALLLGPALIRAKSSQTAAAAIYYLSGRGFHIIYPPDPADDVQLFSPELLQKTPYRNGLPEHNANRLPVWSEAYDDPKGNGLISTLSIPVDDAKGNYRGVMAMDFALDTLSQFVRRPALGIGTAFIIDENGNILAHPTLVREASGKAPTLAQVERQTGIIGEWSSLRTMPASNRKTLSREFALAYDIEAAPWRYLFVVERNQLRWNALKGMYGEAITMLGLLMLILYIESRRRAAVVTLRRKAAEDILYAAPAPIAVVLQSDFSIMLANNALLRLFITNEQFPPEQARANAHIQIHGLLKSLSKQGNMYPSNLTEACLKRADGSALWILACCVPLVHEDKSAWLCSLTEVTALKQAQEQLKILATTDSLTGALNRRAIVARGHDEIKHTKRSGLGFAVLLLDIDHFKHINDTHGHPAGDRVLQAVAKTIQAMLRETDAFGRWGGEEFIGLLHETEMEGLLSAAERIRHAIEELSVASDTGNSIRLTVSIGAAAWLHQGDTLNAIISRCDTALYAAKGAGRNKVCAATDSQTACFTNSGIDHLV
jgi:diguanylate cyclase (GGDEF)-like protein